MGKESDHLERAKYTRKPYVRVSEITITDGRKKYCYTSLNAARMNELNMSAR